MIKIKTIKGALKRTRRISNGFLKYKKANLQHILTKKSKKRKRHLRIKSIVSRSNLSTLKSHLPYK
ncbi:50S ribosomal protein L35 [Candidatus Riesia pediculischaeffi]|uniref:Large ribosomal subunit protein bL35 n=1 Tax=Candidatus Riesia pediculischaeffi TaxID=428411 RepID=A0A1V0HL53_9ENTR|nr:50S ribosomal protein L35 [Candidatus Riesia pediculischaeffi]ARC53451.1 50S ribosomal protein L35 [Candidatus Riesia pediculischaeffi]